MNAPRARVYRALIDANAVAEWMVPTGMTSHVHTFEGCEGDRVLNGPVRGPFEALPLAFAQ